MKLYKMMTTTQMVLMKCRRALGEYKLKQLALSLENIKVNMRPHFVPY